MQVWNMACKIPEHDAFLQFACKSGRSLFPTEVHGCMETGKLPGLEWFWNCVPTLDQPKAVGSLFNITMIRQTRTCAKGQPS